MRRLIVNADDLGLTAGVNRAIVEAHTHGVVTSATVMANGAAFDDAIERLRSAPGLFVGCHVVLVDGAPVSEPGSVPTLVARSGFKNPFEGSESRASGAKARIVGGFGGTAEDLHPSKPKPGLLGTPAAPYPKPIFETCSDRATESGRFYPRLSAFAARAVFGRFDHEQLVSEIVAQVRKLQAAGVEVTHLDTHKHTHIFPSILTALIKAARICGVPAIRNPVVPVNAIRIRQLAGKPGLWKRYGQVRLLRGFAPHFGRRMRRAGLATPDGVVGVVETGSFDGSLLRQMLENLPEGTWELVTHPGYDDEDLRRVRTRLLGSREEERRLLMSRELREFLDVQGIQLTTYRDFALRL